MTKERKQEILTTFAKKEGDTTVKIKYDSGDYDYYYIECDLYCIEDIARIVEFQVVEK